MTTAAVEAPPARSEASWHRHKRSVLLFGALLGLWQLAAATDVASDRLLPGPGEVGGALVDLLQRQYFYENLWATMRVIGLGMLLAVIGGVALAALIGLVPVLRDGVYPYVVGLNIIPKVALVPLLTITMGYSLRSKVVIVVAFFPVFLNTLEAIRDAREDRDLLLQSLGASRLQRLRMHRFPEGASTIFAGIKLGLTIAFIAAILAELFIQRDGLAYLITAFRIALNTPMMYAVTIVIAVVGMACYFVLERLERWIVFWDRGDARSDGGER